MNELKRELYASNHELIDRVCPILKIVISAGLKRYLFVNISLKESLDR